MGYYVLWARVRLGVTADVGLVSQICYVIGVRLSGWAYRAVSGCTGWHGRE